MSEDDAWKSWPFLIFNISLQLCLWWKMSHFKGELIWSDVILLYNNMQNKDYVIKQCIVLKQQQQQQNASNMFAFLSSHIQLYGQPWPLAASVHKQTNRYSMSKCKLQMIIWLMYWSYARTLQC